jgi:hypothetical protein
MVQSPVLSHGGQIFPAGMLVNQAEDECQHDRTPLFDRGADIRRAFQGVFAGRENGFVNTVKSFRGCPAGETSSRSRDPQAGR